MRRPAHLVYGGEDRPPWGVMLLSGLQHVVVVTMFFVYPLIVMREAGTAAGQVADILRDHGPAWRKANAGHVSLGQMKVMSAIEHCRTAALGGHVGFVTGTWPGHLNWLPERLNVFFQSLALPTI